MNNSLINELRAFIAAARSIHGETHCSKHNCEFIVKAEQLQDYLIVIQECDKKECET